MKSQWSKTLPTTERWISENPWQAFLVYFCSSSILYYWASYHPWTSKFGIYSNSLDAMIPYMPAFVTPYLSYFAIVPTFIFLSHKEKYFSKVFLNTCGFVWIHLFVCIIVPSHFSFELPETSSYLGNLLAQADTPFAAFPSGHVGLPICLSLLLFTNAPKQSFLFGSWALLMCVCTLATKQHSIVDVIGGLILGSLVGLTAVSLDDDKKQYFRKKYAIKTLSAVGCEWMIIILALVLSLQFPSWPTYMISFCIIASR